MFVLTNFKITVLPSLPPADSQELSSPENTKKASSSLSLNPAKKWALCLEVEQEDMPPLGIPMHAVLFKDLGRYWLSVYFSDFLEDAQNDNACKFPLSFENYNMENLDSLRFCAFRDGALDFEKTVSVRFQQ